MKKIKSIQQLKAEKKRLRQRQAELEAAIRGNWSHLKEAVKPGNIAKDVFNKREKEDKTRAGENSEGIFKSTLSYGITLLAQKLADKAGNKLEKIFARKNKR